MKRSSLVLVLFCVSFVPFVSAQTITGTGTANTVPKFTGPTTVGDSEISELGGTVSVGPTGGFVYGTTDKVEIRNTSSGVTSGIFAIAESGENPTAAVRGFATSQTGQVIGAEGLTFSNVAARINRVSLDRRR
jgi:hypothetical protein